MYMPYALAVARFEHTDASLLRGNTMIGDNISNGLYSQLYEEM